jgi:hypothetical protein
LLCPPVRPSFLFTPSCGLRNTKVPHYGFRKQQQKNDCENLKNGVKLER